MVKPSLLAVRPRIRDKNSLSTRGVPPREGDAAQFALTFSECGSPHAPAFVLRAGQQALSSSKVFVQLQQDPWHFLGSSRSLCTVHLGGGLGFYLTPRTLIQLTDPARTPEWRVWHRGTRWRAARPERVEFRCGEAVWEYAGSEAETSTLRLERRLRRLDEQVYAVTLCFSGIDGELLYEEDWWVTPHVLLPVPLMGWQWYPPSPRGRLGGAVRQLAVAGARVVRRLGIHVRHILSRGLRYHCREDGDTLRLEPYAVPRWCIWGPRDPGRPALVDATLPELTFAVTACSPNVDARWQHDGKHGSRVTLRARIAANPNHGREAALEFSLRIGGVDSTCQHALAPPLREADFTAPSLPADEPLRQELLWHLASLRQLAVRDDYFERTFITQGSAYLLAHGVHGAPRDYAIAAVAVLPFDPELARSTIETMILLTQPDGAMAYLHAGRGWCSGALVHQSPSDLPIFLLWAVSEYIEQTGDEAFLDRRLPFYPKHRRLASTVQDRLELAYRWLEHRLGVGAHGLLRVGSGDWMDPIALMVGRPARFHAAGESGLNTAFAVHALRRAAQILAWRRPFTAGAMRAFASKLAQAMSEQWTGRWFLRGWDGMDRPLGHDHLFADVQAFCLIAGIGSEEQRATVAKELYERCIAPSPIGACIIDRPHWSRFDLLPPGWDCNGGVWPAINAFLCWGLALHRPEVAQELLEKMRWSARAAASPHIWYGLWSGPDCFQAHYAERAGETFHLPATPMDEFPAMNSNFHAAPLLAWQKLRACTGATGKADDSEDAGRFETLPLRKEDQL